MANKRAKLQNAATATGVGNTIITKPYPVTLMQISGTFSGTVTFQCTLNGSDWVAVQATNVGDGSIATTATSAGAYLVPTAGFMEARSNITAYVSGSITVWAQAVAESPALPQSATVASITGALPAGTNNIGDVDIASIAAGETHIGQVGSHGDTISQTPTVTAGAYAANDAVGGLLTFADAARVSGGGGVIKDVVILDDAGQDAEMELWLFNATFTAMADNAAWAPSEVDLRKLVAVIRSLDGNWLAAGTPSALVVEASQRYDLTGTSLFGQLVARGTPTFAATDDVTVAIGLLMD